MVIKISGARINRYGLEVILNIINCAPKSIYQYDTATTIATANPVSLPCLTLTFESGRVIRVSTVQAMDKAIFFVSSLL